MDKFGQNWTNLDIANFRFCNFAAKKKMRTKADISGHMRTNADSAKILFRNFAS